MLTLLSTSGSDDFRLGVAGSELASWPCAPCDNLGPCSQEGPALGLVLCCCCDLLLNKGLTVFSLCWAPRVDHVGRAYQLDLTPAAQEAVLAG